MKPVDFKKDLSYHAKSEPQIIDIPEMLFLMVDGKGAPESSGPAETEFQQAMQVLFNIMYTIKFWDKKYDPPENYYKFKVTPVEGLWWTKSGQNFDLDKPDDWQWTVMLRVPEFVTPVYFKEVVKELVTRKHSEVYKKARLASFDEGRCVQIMHIGPYNQEQADIEKMHAFAKDNGYSLHGKHHEIYFGDPRRTEPDKLLTILRQPIIRA